jgi:hypothetical protein
VILFALIYLQNSAVSPRESFPICQKNGLNKGERNGKNEHVLSAFYKTSESTHTSNITAIHQAHKNAFMELK